MAVNMTLVGTMIETNMSVVTMLIGWLLGFYVLETSRGISGRVSTSDGPHSRRIYITVPLADQADGIMT